MKTQSYSPRYTPQTAPMVVGGVMLAAGMLIGVAGMIVGCTGMYSSCRMWWHDMAGQAKDAAKPVKSSWPKPAKETISAAARAMGASGAPARSGRG